MEMPEPSDDAISNCIYTNPVSKTHEQSLANVWTSYDVGEHLLKDHILIDLPTLTTEGGSAAEVARQVQYAKFGFDVSFSDGGDSRSLPFGMVTTAGPAIYFGIPYATGAGFSGKAPGAEFPGRTAAEGFPSRAAGVGKAERRASGPGGPGSGRGASGRGGGHSQVSADASANLVQAPSLISMT